MTNQYSFQEFQFSSKLIRDLIEEQTATKPLVQDFFSLSNCIQIAKNKQFPQEKRNTLVEILKTQSKNYPISKATEKNIDDLKNPNTFTIITGHQLNLFTGPIYFIYKILETIEWTKQLNKKSPDLNFVPVFWMATEDHDFEEINHIHLFKEKLEWLKINQEATVAGRIQLDENLMDLKATILDKFKDEELKSKINTFLSHYKNGASLAEVTYSLVNKIFSDEGLIIINGDDATLKNSMKSVFIQEIEKETTFIQVQKTNEYLEKEKYHQQVYLRECNLFYINENGKRIRIEKEKNQFKIENSAYSLAELKEMIEKKPENFSPNALLRPLYQEMVLPNIVYVGGGGEIAYWLQLKEVFNQFKIDFPLLKVRDSILLVREKEIEKLNALDLSIIDLKQKKEDLFKKFILENTEEELNLNTEKNTLLNLKNEILNKSKQIDKGLSTMIEAEFQKMDNQLDKIEKKFIQAEKKNKETILKQIEQLKDKYFPEDGFQERYENILSYWQFEDFMGLLKKHYQENLSEKPKIGLVKL